MILIIFILSINSRFDSGHSTANWHDIPCSLGKHSQHNKNVSIEEFHDTISSYICKMDARISSHTWLQNEPLYVDLLEDYDEEYVRSFISEEKYFICANLEVISIIFRCDGILNGCRSGLS